MAFSTSWPVTLLHSLEFPQKQKQNKPPYIANTYSCARIWNWLALLVLHAVQSHVDVCIQISATPISVGVTFQCAVCQFSVQVLKVSICLVTNLGRSSSYNLISSHILYPPGSMPGPANVETACKRALYLQTWGAEETNISNNQTDRTPFKSMPHKRRKTEENQYGGNSLNWPRPRKALEKVTPEHP